MEFNETWQKARFQRPLPSLCFSSRSEKQDGRPGLWLAETFSTSSLKLLNRIQRTFTGIKISKPSTKFVFFGPIRKTRWPPWPLIGWDIFDFSSETAEWNSTKLDRKQDLNALYQVCVFRADRKNKMAALASVLLRHFGLLLWNPWTEFNETWQEARSQRPLPGLCFSGPIWKTRWPPWPLIGWDIFDFSSETAEPNSMKLDRKQDLNALCQVCVFWADRKNKMAALASDWLRHFRLSSETAEPNSMKLDRKQDLNVLYQVCVFWADRKNKMAALASDWLRHFRLLCRNRWMEFNESWQEARSKRPLPSLCFSGRSEKQDGRRGLWLAETFSTSPLKLLNQIQWNLIGSKISMPSAKFVFFGPIGKTRWPPWPLIGWDISTFPLKPLNRIQQNLIGIKISKPSTKFVFFGQIGKTRWPPWPLIGWDIFDFSVETAEWNSTNVDRKQDLNALYQVCVFRADRKNKMAAWPLIDWDIFDFFSETAVWNSTKLDRNQDLNILYQVCVFWADRKNKMAALFSDWLRHFRLLLWNRWTKFNETW